MSRNGANEVARRAPSLGMRRKSLLMIWGKCLARDRVPQVQSQKRQAERGKQTAGSKNRGNTPGGKDDGGRKRGRRWVLVHGSLVRGVGPGVGRDRRANDCYYSRPGRPDPSRQRTTR